MFTKEVAVLGAGPAGLLAAHAAERKGWSVHIFTAPDEFGEPKKSELHGCQYLHSSIPRLTYTIDGMPVRYLLDGSAEGYRRKVYGDNWAGQVSPDEFGPEKDHYAWDLRRAYDELWDRWRPHMLSRTFTPAIAAMTYSWHRVLCTVPAPALCLQPEDHKFVTQDIWAMGTPSIPEGSSRSEPYWTLPYTAPDNTVQCNGEDAPRWYRAATVFGASTIEWPAGPKPPISGVVAVKKPLSTDCECHVGKRWVRLGRYGKWQKGVLVHTAFEEVLDL